MERSLLLICWLAGCGFSVPVAGDTPIPDAAQEDGGGPLDAATDAIADARTDAMVDAMPLQATVELTSVADLYLRTVAAPDQNTNGVSYFIVDGDVTCTALLRFDLSSLPANATIDAADLLLWNEDDPGQTCTVHRMLEGWDEATATSNRRAIGQAWMGAGATPPSRATIASGTFTPAIGNTAHTIALQTALVQDWIATPSTNHGVAIVTSDDNGSRFTSRESDIAARRPILRVTYTY